MEMVKFEIEVLNGYNYSQLIMTKNQLILVKKMLIKNVKESRSIGLLDLVVVFEKQIDRIKENIYTIDIVMINKEEDLFRFESAEPYCLN